MKSNAPKGTTYGSAWMYRMLIWMLQHINIKVMYAFTSIFVIPVAMVFSPGARVAYHYFKGTTSKGKRARSWWTAIVATYRNHCVFAQTVIDKFSMYAGHQFKVAYVGQETYAAMTQRQEAFLQLSAHIGCSEILGYSYENAKPCNVLVYGGEKASLMAYRKVAFANKNVKMIPVATGNDNSGEIVSALENGEIVSVFADRVMNPEKTLTATLHGRPIILARGPFSMATTRGLDVVMASAMKERDGSYSAYFTPLHYDKTSSQREQRQQLAEAYAAEIERLLQRYPLQWFNYSQSKTYEHQEAKENK